MHVDIILNEFDSPKALAEQAALAESYGFRAVWSASYATGRDCFLSLVLAAQSTSKILLGPGKMPDGWNLRNRSVALFALKR